MTQDLNDKIGAILAELYEIEPALKAHEANLRATVAELLRSKPDTRFDAAFAVRLRRQLLARADLRASSPALLPAKKPGLFGSLGLAAGALATIAIVALLVRQAPDSGQKDAALSLLSARMEIKPLDRQAFGKLALNTQDGTGSGLGGYAASGRAAAAPLGMGGGESKTMPALAQYKYVYRGQEFKVEQSQMEVYRRVKAPVSGTDITPLLKTLNFGLVDANSFNGLSLQNMNLAEDKDFGYMLYVNLQDGSIAISENWQRWPTPDKQCREQQCLDSLRLKMEDIPDDRTLIKMAGQFLKDRGITTDNYDAPFVEDSWKIEYNNAADKANSYIPNIITVIYPLKVNGNVVYDEGGRKTGLAVSVDLLANRVSGIGELRALNFESSLYDLETDRAALIKVAEKGGFYGQAYEEQANQAAEVELGTPEIVYVKTYQYNPAARTSEELLVPSLSFPVTKPPAGRPFYQKNVVVPLAKDLMAQDSGPVRILPAP